MSEGTQWVFALWLAYGLPSFVAGIVVTLLVIRLRRKP
jgi:hypothetical protein